jgi:tetratricopeptide (TPR) repeat protein
MAALPILLALIIGAISPLAAAGLGEAEARYQRGDMVGAANLARSAASAEGFVLAAKATLVQATYLSPMAEKRALLEQAMTDAKEALALDPDQVDAHLQLAIALGQMAELDDPISAHVNGYAEEGKVLLDQALALDPDNAWARALLGMWHLRIVERAGDALAEGLYGASRAAGVELCSRALAGMDAALELRYGCALTLVELDPDEFEDTAEAALAKVKDSAPRDAADSLAQAAATSLLDELRSGGVPETRSRCRRHHSVTPPVGSPHRQRLASGPHELDHRTESRLPRRHSGPGAYGRAPGPGLRELSGSRMPVLVAADGEPLVLARVAGTSYSSRGTPPAGEGTTCGAATTRSTPDRCGTRKASGPRPPRPWIGSGAGTGSSTTAGRRSIGGSRAGG